MWEGRMSYKEFRMIHVVVICGCGVIYSRKMRLVVLSIGWFADKLISFSQDIIRLTE